VHLFVVDNSRSAPFITYITFTFDPFLSTNGFLAKLDKNLQKAMQAKPIAEKSEQTGSLGESPSGCSKLP
jgi:hypothetical protein